MSLNIETLEDRREKIAKNFVLKVLKHPVHRDIFKFVDNSRTRSSKRVIEPVARTSRYYRSTVPSLARMINGAF